MRSRGPREIFRALAAGGDQPPNIKRPAALTSSGPKVALVEEGGPVSEAHRGEEVTRPSRTGQLHALRRVDLPPIDLVVFEGPLGAQWPGSPHLEAGFPLRCFQRLSPPDIATRHCRWRDNRHTSGPSLAVLSY